MEEKDEILAKLYALVRRYTRPEDNPVSTQDIEANTHLPLQQVLFLCEEMAEDGFLIISNLHSPPLAYITPTGIARAHRLNSSFVNPSFHRTF